MSTSSRVKPVAMRDLRTADSATKVLERAADANAMAHRALGLGQRMALLGQLSACLGALATEESKARQEIARAKEYAQWMGGLADEEDELYRSDRRPTLDSTLDNQLGDAAGRRTSTSASHVGSEDGAPMSGNAIVRGSRPPTSQFAKTFILSEGARKALEDPAFDTKAHLVHHHQAISSEATRRRDGCVYWYQSTPFELNAQQRRDPRPGTTTNSPPASEFTRALCSNRPDSALTSLRTGQLGGKGGASPPPPAARAVVHRSFFPYEDAQNADQTAEKAFATPTATVEELRDRCICLRAVVTTDRHHTSIPGKAPRGLGMMRCGSPSEGTELRQAAAEIGPSAPGGPMQTPSTQTPVSTAAAPFPAALTPSKTGPVKSGAVGPPVVTSDVELEFGVETDLRPRWAGAGSTLPAGLGMGRKAATASKGINKTPSQQTVNFGLSAVEERDHISLASSEVGDFIHYLADAMDHAAAHEAAHSLPPPTGPFFVMDDGDPLGSDEVGNEAASPSTWASMIEGAVSEAQAKHRSDEGLGFYDDVHDGQGSRDHATTSPPAGPSDNWTVEANRRSLEKKKARAFRAALNKIMTDENDQRWELVHTEASIDKKLFKLFRIDHAKAQREVLSAQRKQRRDLERMLTLDLLKIVIIWESQHEELYTLFRTQHAILHGIAVGRNVLNVEEADARGCLEGYEWVERRQLWRTFLGAKDGPLDAIQRRFENELKRIHRERDEESRREQIRSEETEFELQCRADEILRREKEKKDLEEKRHREAFMHGL